MTATKLDLTALPLIDIEIFVSSTNKVFTQRARLWPTFNTGGGQCVVCHKKIKDDEPIFFLVHPNHTEESAVGWCDDLVEMPVPYLRGTLYHTGNILCTKCAESYCKGEAKKIYLICEKPRRKM